MLKFHAGHLESLWQDSLPAALVVDAAVGPSHGLSGPTTLLPPGCPECCLLLARGWVPSQALPLAKQDASSKAVSPPGVYIQGLANTCNTPAWPWTSQKGQPIRPPTCKSPSQSLFQEKNPTFFSKTIDTIHDSPVSTHSQGFLRPALATWGALLPSPLLEGTSWNVGPSEWHCYTKTQTKSLEQLQGKANHPLCYH